jgi:hypothetical protein
MDGRPNTLLASVRRFWPWYLPAWLFPLVLYASVFFMPVSGGPNWVFVGVDMPLFFISFAVASVPYHRKLERYGHSIVLGMLVPFLIWGLAIFGPFLLLLGIKTAIDVSS